MKNSNNKRTEKDLLGSIKIPKKAYYGAFTARAKNNFQISGITAPEIFIEALGLVKLAAARSNEDLGLLSKKQAKAIKQACEEFINKKFSDDFTLDVYQAGAGTSYNMNANEIIANRANEILKGKKGKYEFIHPNNHVNLAQSSNDVIPTAVRISVILKFPELITELEKLIKEFEKKSKDYKNILKVGRTHLQDAAPITLGQEFDSYTQALTNSKNFISEQLKQLYVLGIGGTAVGTGLNSDPKYKKLMIMHLSKLIGTRFKSAKNLTEIANNMNVFMNISASLRSLCTNLINISHDLKLLSMGPKAGLYEISLPKVQPGSSIMPGKINPSIPESLEMVCYQVLGNDKTIELAAQRSQLELNVMCPLIMYNLLSSLNLLANGIKTFRNLCVKGIKINKDVLENFVKNSLCTATALNPYLGYELTSEIVKTSLEKNISIEEEVLERKLMKKKKFQEITSVKSMTKPRKSITK